MSMPNVVYRHWRVERDALGLAWATLDRAGESTNALSRAVMDDLAAILPAERLSRAAEWQSLGLSDPSQGGDAVAAYL